MSAVHQANPRARSGQAVYKRPQHDYSHDHSASLAERLDTLGAAFTEADEKLECAYDHAEPGSAAEVLLEHVAHGLLVDATPDSLKALSAERTSKPTDALAHAHAELFTVLAALEGVMALSMGTIIHATLAEAFRLLEWAQEECEELSTRH